MKTGIFYEMAKWELGQYLTELSYKIDSGRHTGADVQNLKVATKIYMERFEPSLLAEISKAIEEL